MDLNCGYENLYRKLVDIPKIQDVYTYELFLFFQEIIQFVVGFILAMTVNWRMSLILGK